MAPAKLPAPKMDGSSGIRPNIHSLARSRAPQIERIVKRDASGLVAILTGA